MKEDWMKDQVSFLDDVDRFELDSRIREQEATMARLDANYERIDRDKLRERGYPAGSVVIIRQGEFLKNNEWIYEFYRTVLIYWGNKAEPNRAKDHRGPKPSGMRVRPGTQIFIFSICTGSPARLWNQSKPGG